MKKSFIKCIAGILLGVTTVSSVAAIPVFDAANFAVNTTTSVESGISAAADPVTSIQQTLDTVNKTILIPIRDALILIQIMQNGKMIQTLITGALGSEALLVTNPELYLKNKTLAVTQGGIDALAAQKNSIYGNSVIASVVRNTKNSQSSLTTQLNLINTSSIPSIQQNKICNNDAELSALARADANATGADYNARKTELYNMFCRCDPKANTDDGKQCARRLATLANRQPSLDTFYAMTQGDNAYVKAQLSQSAIAEDAAKKQELAKADLNQGGGVKSKTTCTKFASNGLCIEQQIQQTSAALMKSFQDALSSGLNTAISSFGSGAGSLIGTVFQTISLVQGINTSIGGISGGGSSGSNTVSRPTTTSTPTTHNQTTTSTSGYQQDLVNNPQTRANLSNAPMDQLNFHKTSLQELRSTDNAFLGELNGYESKLNALTACFDNLAQLYPGEIGGYANQVEAANAWVSSIKSSNASKRATIQSELAKIGSAESLINSTISTLQSSNSTQQITDTFQNYQNQVRSQNLPDSTSNIVRAGELKRFQADVTIATMEGGRYFNFDQQCKTIGSQIQQGRYSGNGY